MADVARRLCMTEGALRVFLHRHPDLARRRYQAAPRQAAQLRRRLITEAELLAIRQARVKEFLAPDRCYA